MAKGYLLFLLPLFLFTCGGPEGEHVTSNDPIDQKITMGEDGETEMTVQDSRQYLVKPNSSTVYWEGTKLVGGGHTGEIPVEFGQIVVTNGDDRIAAGRFTLDINKITNTDMPADDGGDDLVKHLKSEDFFDVAKHPTATFDLVSIEPVSGRDYGYEFVGNLTLKGIQRSITVPADMTLTEKEIRVTTPQFVIDRNEWGIVYGNSTLASAKDKIINDKVGLKIDLVAEAE